MFTVALEGADALGARITGLPASVQAALSVKAAELAARLQAHVVQDKLSGQVLNAVGGALAGSIADEVTADGQAVQARVYSTGDVKYAAIQEYGGRSGPHDIVPSKGEALAFLAGGQRVFAKIVHHPGSQIPERSYLRSALADMASEIGASLKQVVVEALQKGAA